MGALKAQPKKDSIKELFETQIPLIFTLTELTWWKALLSKWFNIVVTFVWSFMDLFVMVVSIGLASQFKQINADLKRVKGRVKVFFFLSQLLHSIMSQLQSNKSFFTANN